MLKDRGLLRRDGETWRLDGTDVEVPETVQGIIAARLDALASEEKEALQAASVVGKVFWLGSVAAIAVSRHWEAEERLHALERKELVRRDRRASVAERDGVRSAARARPRRRLRPDPACAPRRPARRGRRSGSRRSATTGREDRAEMLAHHYVSALELTRAAGGDAAALEVPARIALREAGNRAYALSALESAAAFHAKALELWPRGRPRLSAPAPRARPSSRPGCAPRGLPSCSEAADRFLAAGERRGGRRSRGESWRRVPVQRPAAGVARALRARARAHRGPPRDARYGVDSSSWLACLRCSRVSVSRSRRAGGSSLSRRSSARRRKSSWRGSRSVSPIPRAATRTPPSTCWSVLSSSRAEANSHLVGRACVNLASVLAACPATSAARRGSIVRGSSSRAASGAASSTGSSSSAPLDDFIAGDWDAAIAGATSYLEHRGAGRFMDAVAYQVLAATAAARGDRS